MLPGTLWDIGESCKNVPHPGVRIARLLFDMLSAGGNLARLLNREVNGTFVSTLKWRRPAYNVARFTTNLQGTDWVHDGDCHNDGLDPVPFAAYERFLQWCVGECTSSCRLKARKTQKYSFVLGMRGLDNAQRVASKVIRRSSGTGINNNKKRQIQPVS